MSDVDDGLEYLIIDEDDRDIVPTPTPGTPWKVLIVDDEEMIHKITRIALTGFTFAGRPLQLDSAYSGEEAKAYVRENSDVALVLLDVVMEKDDAGLQVVEYIRNDLRNEFVRIVLRTGQAGMAPESDVIVRYDINDYKDKTELTATKLTTVLFSSLRSYRDIITIDSNRRGLRKVIDATASIFQKRAMEQLSKGVLEQLVSLVHADDSAVFAEANRPALAARVGGDELTILAGTGQYERLVGASAKESLPEDVYQCLRDSISFRAPLLVDNQMVAYIHTDHGSENVLYLEDAPTLSVLDRDLVELFTKNAAIAFENHALHQDIDETQREIVYMLGEAVETRSRETGNHVKRVAEISALLARAGGLGDQEVELIKLASPLHDVGKIGIPDEILNKPGKHTTDEFEIMKKHALMGHDMLAGSKRRILEAGAIIARDHHERWDGSGYPFNKSGADIHVFGRITAIVDVFDALSSDRCYKAAWPINEVVDYIQQQCGSQFDPAYVTLFMQNLDQALNIRDAYRDEFESVA